MAIWEHLLCSLALSHLDEDWDVGHVPLLPPAAVLWFGYRKLK